MIPDRMDAVATEKNADTLRRVCVHMSPAHLDEAKRLSKLLRSPEGRRMTSAAVMREALELGLELLNSKSALHER